MDNKRSCLAIFLIVSLLPIVAWAKQDESTPTTLLRAIEQRNEELDRKSKNLLLKEQRMRILEEEVTEKLNQIKKTREEIRKKEAAEKKLAEEVKKKAMAKTKAAKESAAKAKAAQDRSDARVKTKTTQDKADAELAQAKADLAQAKADLAQAKADAAAAKADPRTRSNAQQGRGKARPKSQPKGSGVKAAEAAEAADEEMDMAPLEEQEKLAAINKKEASRKALEEKRFKELAKIYDKMPPQEAGLRLQNMHEIIALEIIPRMNKKKSAKALASMDPVVAVRYTERLGMGGPFFPQIEESPSPKESSQPKQ